MCYWKKIQLCCTGSIEPIRKELIKDTKKPSLRFCTTNCWSIFCAFRYLFSVTTGTKSNTLISIKPPWIKNEHTIKSAIQFVNNESRWASVLIVIFWNYLPKLTCQNIASTWFSLNIRWCQVSEIFLHYNHLQISFQLFGIISLQCYSGYALD